MNRDNDIEALMYEDRISQRRERARQRQMVAHPDCRDPDHPGCSDCNETSDDDS